MNIKQAMALSALFAGIAVHPLAASINDDPKIKEHREEPRTLDLADRAPQPSFHEIGEYRHQYSKAGIFFSHPTIKTTAEDSDTTKNSDTDDSAASQKAKDHRITKLERRLDLVSRSPQKHIVNHLNPPLTGGDEYLQDQGKHYATNLIVNQDDIDSSANHVPEPTSLALLALGFLALGILQRKKILTLSWFEKSVPKARPKPRYTSARLLRTDVRNNSRLFKFLHRRNLKPLVRQRTKPIGV